MIHWRRLRWFVLARHGFVPMPGPLKTRDQVVVELGAALEADE